MTIPKTLPFDQINERCLSGYLRLLEQWFPNGKRRGHEYLVGNLRGDPGESLSINIDTGKWQDFGDITEPKGGDPLSLFAAAFFGGTGKQHRIAACRRLMTELGICSDPVPSKVVPIRPDVVSKARKEDDWVSMVPPADAGVPKVKPGVTRLHVYRDADGQPLRYVARYDRPTKKEFLPYTYGTLNGELGWHPKHPNPPMCLYGLDRRAANPKLRILLQEGEQKSDLVQERVPAFVCMGWSGGGHRAKDHDYGPTSGAEVIVSGDAGDGEKGMMEAAALCHEAGADPVWTLDTSDYPKGWDLGNAVLGEMIKHGELVWKDPDGPWSAEKIEAFIEARQKLYIPETGNVDEMPDLGEPADDTQEDGEDPATWGQDRDGIIPLGFNNNVHYYLPKKGGQVLALTPNGHSELQMRAMASQAYWYGTRFRKEDGGIDWKGAAGFFMGACQSLPIYTPDRLRGTGAWMDGKRSVLNMGEHLIVDGHGPYGMRLSGSSFVYERKASLNKTIAAPVSTEDAGKLDGIIRDLRWEKPIFGKLMSGWLALAPICGALHWRPPIWVTGGSGAGKTTLDTNIVSPILEGLCERMASNSTEAGIRQRLGNNALPIIFDEAEAEGLTDKQRIQHILDLVRQATSEGAAAIVKGTQSQTGAISYTVRSCFMFLSINVSLNRQADESRITVLALENPPIGDQESQAHYDRVMQRVAQLVTPQFCAGYIARQVWLMPVIRDNAVTFSRAVSSKLGSSRVGDQIGTLCAGFHSTHSTGRISLESAIAWVEKQDWEGATAADAITDEQRLVNRLLLRRLVVRSNSGGTTDRTVAELLTAAAGRDSDVNIVNANDALKRNGIIYQPANIGENQPCGMWVANQHDALADFLKDTPWASASSWKRALKRFPGSIASTSTYYFAGVYSRAIFVPVRLPGSMKM